MKLYFFLLLTIPLPSFGQSLRPGSYLCGQGEKKAYVSIKATELDLPLISIQVKIRDFVSNKESVLWQRKGLAMQIDRRFQLGHDVHLLNSKKNLLSAVTRQGFTNEEVSFSERFRPCKKQ